MGLVSFVMTTALVPRPSDPSGFNYLHQWRLAIIAEVEMRF